MKTKTLLLTLAGVLLLGACAVDEKKNEVSNSSAVDPLPSSSIVLTNEKISEQALDELVTKLSTPKQKMDITIGEEDYGYVYFTDKGFVEVYDGEKQGCVLNNQAWFQFDVTDGAVV